MVTKKVKRKKLNIFVYGLYAFIMLVMNGCTMLGQPLNLNQKIAVYAEDVFKHQNQVTQQIMMLFEEELSDAEELSVSESELAMYDACQLLNQYAANESEGKKMSVFFRTRLKRSLAGCENEVFTMERVLKSILSDQAHME